MKLNEGVEWALHCCALLAALPSGKALPAYKLAHFFELPAPYLAKHLQQLSAADLVETLKGPKGGYRLAKPANKVSLLDIVEAIDGRSPCFQCTEIRQNGPTAASPKSYKSKCVIARAMHAAEEAWRTKLAQVSLQEIQFMGLAEMPSDQVEKTAVWMRDMLS